ncbi:FAD-binding oxidoreductase [Mesorhizobium sp. M0129]
MLPSRIPRPSVNSDQQVDYAIVGAGYTGLAVARRLHEIDPQARITVIEATTIGEGSSGRNSGFFSTDVLTRYGAAQSASMSAETSLAQTKLMKEAFAWLRATVVDNSIECGMQQTGAIRSAASDAGEAYVRRVKKVVEARNLPHTVLGREAIRDGTGADYYQYGLWLHNDWVIQPAMLIRGLADTLPESIVLYENSPVRNMHRDRTGWGLLTDGGLICARTVVLANNGYKLGYLKSRMTTIFTYAAITEAVSEDDIGFLGQWPTWGMVPAHRAGTTTRRITRDRLMVRSLHSLTEIPNATVERQLRERFVRRWPGLRHVSFEHVWGGAISFTNNAAPWWGQIEDGLYASTGCNGSGIIKCTMLGRRLAEIIRRIGHPDEVTSAMGVANWMVPDPFRTIGFHIISAMESRKAGLES